MRLLCGLVILLIYVPVDTTETVVLSTLKESSIECASTAELTFKFVSRKTKKRLTIAECDLMMKSCRMLETALENKYNLTYTGRGGILHITSVDDDTKGTYTCCETYNPSNFVSTDIISPCMNVLDNVSYGVYTVANTKTENLSGESRTEQASPQWTILVVCFALVISVINISVIITMKKCRVSKAMEKITDEKTDLLELHETETTDDDIDTVLTKHTERLLFELQQMNEKLVRNQTLMKRKDNACNEDPIEHQTETQNEIQRMIADVRGFVKRIEIFQENVLENYIAAEVIA